MRDCGNKEKLQSDWCRSVQNGITTPCIASHQTLSLCVRVWLHETRYTLTAHVLDYPSKFVHILLLTV